MKVYRLTKTLDGYLPLLGFTDDKNRAEVILVGGKTIELQAFPNLKGIFKTGVGTDNLPFSEARTRGILIGLPSEETCNVVFEETAAFTCHLILKGLYVEAGEWATWHKANRKALRQHRLLIVGTGRIGSRVAEKMGCFMEVDTFDSGDNAIDDLERKVRLADCVSVHVPLTEETEGLFNDERLSWLPDGALLVNTARGAVVDEKALHAEVSSGRLRVAFDVFWEEPYRGIMTDLPDERFIHTPHVASTCREFLQGASTDFLRFLQRISEARSGTTID